MQEDAARIALLSTLPADDGLHDGGALTLDGGVEPLLVGDDEFGDQCLSMVFDFPSQQERFLVSKSREAEGVLHPANEAAAIQRVPDFTPFQVNAHGKAKRL